MYIRYGIDVHETVLTDITCDGDELTLFQCVIEEAELFLTPDECDRNLFDVFVNCCMFIIYNQII